MKTFQMKNDEECSTIDLLDILQGYSVLEFEGKEYYFKHFSMLQFLRLDGLRQKDIRHSVKTGIKKEKDLIDRAIEVGGWSLKEEEKIKSLEWMIKKSTVALGKIEDPTQRKTFKSQIDGQHNELKAVKGARAEITKFSAEHLAETKKISRLVGVSLFSDLNFKKGVNHKLELPLTAHLFSRYAELNNKDSLLKASYHGGFFDIFAAQKGNSIQLFGVSLKDLTIFQKYILVVSNSLLNKLKNTKIPDEIYGDPVKMMDYEEGEYKDKETSHGVDDLKNKMRARGGELKAEDFLS